MVRSARRSAVSQPGATGITELAGVIQRQRVSYGPMVSVSTYRPPVIGTFRAIGRMSPTSCARRIARTSAGPGAGYGLETDPPAAVYALEWIRSMANHAM